MGAHLRRYDASDATQLDSHFDRAEILLAGHNFGCGSSREHAVWAIRDLGFRCIIAKSFGDTFYFNCLTNGLLAITLGEDEVDRLVSSAGDGKILVDLENQRVQGPDGGVYPFEMDGFQRDSTLFIGDFYIEAGSETGAQDKMIELSLRYRKEYFRRIGAAIAAGVKVAVGSDFGGYGYSPELNARELASLIEAGMTPMQAIQAATRVGAELLGWDDRLGTVEAGKLADLIAVDGNPLEDIAELESVDFVMLGGKVVVAYDRGE